MAGDSLEWLGDLAVFARVVEAGSFSAAARRLGTTKSAVSKQVARLEAELGARLLHRSTRRLALTDIGASVLDHARGIGDEATALRATVAGLQDTPRGLLRVSAGAPLAARHVAPFVPGFLARYPEVRLTLSINDRNVDLAEEGFDLGLRMTASPDEHLVARPLAALRYLVVAAPDYLVRAGTPLAPADLAAHCCVLHGQQSHRALWRFVAAADVADAVEVEVAGPFIVNSSEAALMAVRAGAGIALLPSFVAGDALRAGQLVRLLAPWQASGPLGAQLVAVHLPNPRPVPKLRAFIDHLVECFGDPPYWDAGLD